MRKIKLPAAISSGPRDAPPLFGVKRIAEYMGISPKSFHRNFREDMLAGMYIHYRRTATHDRRVKNLKITVAWPADLDLYALLKRGLPTAEWWKNQYAIVGTAQIARFLGVSERTYFYRYRDAMIRDRAVFSCHLVRSGTAHFTFPGDVIRWWILRQTKRRPEMA
ncbi:MAG: hypothetical protein AB2L11_07320 [Syntrophobacteraceae bacterium]